MRVGGEALHIGAEIGGTGNGAELFFPLALDARGFGGVTEEGLLVGDHVSAERSERETGTQKGSKGETTFHGFPLKWRPYCA
jgi:hypothetical protein